MPQIQHSWYQYGDELWKQKRMVWFGSENTKDKDNQPEVVKKPPIGQAAIEDYKGKSAEQAREQVKSETGLGREMIEKRLDHWKRNKISIPNIGLEGLNFGNKALLEDQVNGLALKRVKETAKNLNVRTSWIEKRANGSLAVRNEKVKILSDHIQELDKMIIETKSNKVDNDQAIASLGFIKRIRLPFSDDLKTKIARLEMMQGMATELKAQTEGSGSAERQKAAMEHIGAIDGQLRGIILKKDPLLAGELNRVILAEILKTPDLYKQGGLDKFLKANKKRLVISDTEEKTCKALLDMLKSGNFTANVSAGLLGNFSKRDVENYYISQHVERGELNRKGDNTAERIDRLKDLPLGQSVRIRKETYNVISKPDAKYNGFLIKQGDKIAFIDISNKEKPILTIEDNGKFESMEMDVVEANEINLRDVEFDAVGGKFAQPQSEIETQQESEREQGKVIKLIRNEKEVEEVKAAA